MRIENYEDAKGSVGRKAYRKRNNARQLELHGHRRDKWQGNPRWLITPEASLKGLTTPQRAHQVPAPAPLHPLSPLSPVVSCHRSTREAIGVLIRVLDP